MTNLRFTSDNRFLRSFSADNTLRIWSVEEGTILSTISSKADLKVVRGDSDFVSVVGDDGLLRQVDMADPSHIVEYDPLLAIPSDTAFVVDRNMTVFLVTKTGLITAWALEWQK